MWHVGVAGDPVDHSLSPLLQQRALDYLGLAGETRRLQTRTTRDVADFLAGEGFRALSITTPLKESMVQACDRIDDIAARVGAVNSVIRRDGEILGRNVDGEGLVQALETLTGVSATGCEVIVLGGGGAARSCVAALQSHGAEVTVVTRRPLSPASWSRGARLSNSFDIPRTTAWIINATSSTLTGQQVALGSGGPDSAVAMDLSYGRPSSFLDDCASRGWETFDGLAMLHFQAKLQFEWWFEQEIDLQVLGWSL